MDKWRVSCIDSDLELIKGFKRDKDCISAKKILEGSSPGADSRISHVVKIYQSRMQKDVIESLILAEDCSIDEISELTKIDSSIVSLYEKIFFRISDAFVSKLDLLDYIETGIDYYSSLGSDYTSQLESFLLKRWTISLGKEFVIWRYRLKPVIYTPASLYNTILKEAFFYHKEKSMGNQDITLSEYLRSASSLLGNVKNGTAIKESSEADASLDMLEHLDIIIEDVKPPMETLDELDSEDFINNATQQEKA